MPGLFRVFDHPVLGRGFRPFFLMGAAYAVFIVPLWILHLSGSFLLRSPFEDPVLWHGHELIYGFTMAIVAGFLLTAVANWTGGAPARQAHLALLCFLWLAGRVAMNIDIPYALAGAINLAFIPALAASLAIPLIDSRNTRNFIFLGLLAILFLSQLCLFFFQEKMALYLAIMMIASMISLVGGRIIPAFTVAALRRQGSQEAALNQPWADKLALLSVVTLGLLLFFAGLDSQATALVSLAAAAIHLWRMRGWHAKKTRHDPLLWILHLGYLWLAASFVMLALSFYFPEIPISIAIHTLTVGAIGSMTIGMMVRVTLGHTGRELKAGPGGTLAFVLMQFAVFARVFLPLYDMGRYSLWLEISAGFWAASFMVYLLFLAPALWRPRPDGLPA